MQTQLASIEPVVDRLFQALHGYYGNQFLDKYRTGQSTAKGDVGIENAKKVWASELSVHGAGTIAKALATLRDSGNKFAPSLPEFMELCKAHRRPAPMESRIEYMNRTGQQIASPETVAKAQEQIRRLTRRRVDGVSNLLQNVAKAVALAGGDEVATLRQLEEDIYRRG